MRLPGLGTTARLTSDVEDPVTFQGGLGLSAKKDGVSFNLTYNINASEHLTSHGVSGTIRYEF